MGCEWSFCVVRKLVTNNPVVADQPACIDQCDQPLMRQTLAEIDDMGGFQEFEPMTGRPTLTIGFLTLLVADWNAAEVVVGASTMDFS